MPSRVSDELVDELCMSSEGRPGKIKLTLSADFIGAFLENVCREAAMSSLRENIQNDFVSLCRINFSRSVISILERQ